MKREILLSFIAGTVLFMSTNNWVYSADKYPQPCDNTSPIFKPCTEKSEVLIAPIVWTAIRVIAMTMTVKVGEDVLVGWIADKYGATWKSIIATKTDSQLKQIAVIADGELKNITIGNQRVSVGDFTRAFK